MYDLACKYVRKKYTFCNRTANDSNASSQVTPTFVSRISLESEDEETQRENETTPASF